MLNIFLSADSRNRSVVLNHFSYLADRGYRFTSTTINEVVESYQFEDEKGNVVKIDFDVREEFVNLLVKKDGLVLINLDYEIKHYSPDLKHVQVMLNLVQTKYDSLWMRKRGSSSLVLKEVVKIYSEYLKPYLADS